MKIDEFKKKLKKVTLGAQNCSVTGVHLIYTKEEWLERAKEMFGDDEFKWEFKCPSCKNIQTPADFKELIENGIDGRLPIPNDAYYNCIGRFTGTKNEIFSKEQPCNYTLGGLMHLSHTVVKDGNSIHVLFDFPEDFDMFESMLDEIKVMNDTLEAEDWRRK